MLGVNIDGAAPSCWASLQQVFNHVFEAHAQDGDVAVLAPPPIKLRRHMILPLAVAQMRMQLKCIFSRTLGQAEPNQPGEMTCQKCANAAFLVDLWWWRWRVGFGRLMRIRRKPLPEAPLRVLEIGAIHGDELSATSFALHWTGHAMEAPSKAHWRFIPALNPDGLMGRQTRRMNANGVDLNRNFPTSHWERDATR